MGKILAATSILVPVFCCMSICPPAKASHKLKHGGARQPHKITVSKASPEQSFIHAQPNPRKLQLSTLSTTNGAGAGAGAPLQIKTKIPQRINPSPPLPVQSDAEPLQFTSAKISSLYDQARYDDCAFWVGDDSGLSLGSDDLSLSLKPDATIEPNQDEGAWTQSPDDTVDNTRSRIGVCFLATGVL